jgi:hypothetical protein
MFPAPDRGHPLGGAKDASPANPYNVMSFQVPALRRRGRLGSGLLHFVGAGVDWNPNSAFRRFALVPICRGSLDSRLSESGRSASRI